MCDDLGRRQYVTSYSDDDTTNVVNDVQFKYNDLGMLIQEFQAHAGAVDDDPEGGVSPNVQYGYKATFGTYNGMSSVYTKAMRLAEVIYPNEVPGTPYKTRDGSGRMGADIRARGSILKACG